MKRYNLKEKAINLLCAGKETIKKLPKKVKIIFIFLIIFIIIVVAIFNIIKKNQKQKYVQYDGKNLKESKYPGYKELIDNLIKEHPNWTFTLFYTRLDWNDVIANEGHSDDRVYPLNLIPDSTKYPEDWKCEIDGDKKYDNGTWLCASDKAIKNQMDPRNILNNENIFEIEELKYVENAQTKLGIEEITKDSFLEGDSISEALIEAGKNSNFDPYFIASRLIQEQGKKGTALSKGYEYNNEVIFNPFNINAKGNSQEEILKNAAEYAYEQNWDSLEKALIGGIDFVKKGYIDKGQNTLYLQKFDIVNKDNSLYSNQYMQNLLAPKSEASNMMKIYETSNTKETSLNFIVPLYENMPQNVSE